MAETIHRLTVEDFDPLIRFLNRAFGFNPACGFDRLLPRLYRPDPASMGCNYAIKSESNGSIMAVAGLFPIRWRVGNAMLRIAGVGGVAVAPEYRGRGLMHRLMNEIAGEIRAQRFDLSYLGGQRQRYGRYGWETAGCDLAFEVNQANIRNELQRSSDVSLTLEHFDSTSHSSARCQFLHGLGPASCHYDAGEFPLRLNSWSACSRVAKDSTGRIVGYAVTDQQGLHLWELATEDLATRLRMIRLLASNHAVSSSLTIHLDPSDSTLCREVGAFAEEISLRGAGNWLILNWLIVLQAMLLMKHAAYCLSNGSVVIGVEGSASMRLTVEGDMACCEMTDDPPDVDAGARTMTRLLFGPSPPDLVLPLSEKATILRSWCPLPLRLPKLDQV